MYIRFVVGTDSEHHHSLTGVITEARMLRDRGELEVYEIDLLEEIYEWLNEHLPCPPFTTSKWPKDVVSWFKPTATEPIKKMWEIVNLLREHDVPVRVLKSEMPGRSYYSDDFQIVVLEKKRL
jgi:hypothetical protein